LRVRRKRFIVGTDLEPSSVIRPSNSYAIATLLAAGALVGGSVLAQTPTPAVPTQQELSRVTPSGNYLAGRQANILRDSAAASAYYRAALRADPKNPEILELAFYSALAEGDIDEAVKLADRLLVVDKNNRNTRLVLGVRALKQKNYASARTQLSQAARGPITDLIATLLSGWAQYGAGDAKGAVATIDKLSGPDWYGIFKNLHAGQILDLAGQRKEAGKRFEAAYKLDGNALRVVQAYGNWLSRNGTKEEALAVFQGFDKVMPNHPLIVASIATINKGEKLPPLVDSVSAGAADALYGLGSALTRREEELSLANRGLAYLQLSLYLNPQQQLALLSLADLYEAMKKPELAVNAYSRLPADSPLKRGAEIQTAINLDSLERTDEAKKILERLAEAKSDNRDALLALGNIQRERKQYQECADTYGKAIATIPTPERPHWAIFFSRGICYERAKQWDKAEVDLKKALELYPDQPQVLNYLGYSWVDQHINLDEGVRMIKRSVEQRPDDGYIVDSLGWAYYRLGNYEEAVKQLDRAVELKPTDPTINDHLGDAYWKVGRTLEARFQWAHARDLKPEPDDLKKIEEKLKSGLVDPAPAPTAGAEPEKKKDNGG
jgi:tetratricopeptide (TPR) repeat protein